MQQQHLEMQEKIFTVSFGPILYIKGFPWAEEPTL